MESLPRKGTIYGGFNRDKPNGWDGYVFEYEGVVIPEAPEIADVGCPFLTMTDSHTGATNEIIELRHMRAYGPDPRVWVEAHCFDDGSCQFAVCTDGDFPSDSDMTAAKRITRFMLGYAKNNAGAPPMSATKKAKLRRLARGVDNLLAKETYLHVSQACARKQISVPHYYQFRDKLR